MSNVDKEFIPYKLALILKELGYDFDPVGYHRHDMKGKPVISTETAVRINCLSHPAILYQQAFKFFREKCELDVNIRKLNYGIESKFTGYYFTIYRGNELIFVHGADQHHKIYEKAELACLKQLIQIIKNK